MRSDNLAPAPRLRHSGQPRSVWCVLATSTALTVLSATGCAVAPTARPVRSIESQHPERYLEEYSGRITSSLDELGHQDTPDAPVTTELPEAALAAARGAAIAFSNTLEEYAGVVAKLGESWETMSAADLRTALQATARVHAALQERALEVATRTAELERIFDDVTAATSQEEDGSLDVTRAREELRVFQRVTALTSSVDQYLSTLHQKGLTPYSSVPHAAAGVFHFLRLEALRFPHLSVHSAFFEASWNDWISAERKEGHYDRALAVFAVVLETSKEHMPRTLQPLYEIVYAGLDTPPTLDVVRGMQASLIRTAEIIRTLPRQPVHWRTELTRANAALDLCRARVQNDPSEGLGLAARALEMDPHLEVRVQEYVREAAHAIGLMYIAHGQYLGAVDAFRRALDVVPMPEKESHVHRYRSDIALLAAKDAGKTSRAGQHEAARRIAEQGLDLANTNEERRAARGALHACFLRHIDSLLPSAPSRALQVAEQMLVAFPRDARARKRMDDALLGEARLRIGDLATSRERLGPDGILAILRDTVPKLETDDGTASCQDLLDAVRQAWRDELTRGRDPLQAYEIGLQTAQLRGSGSTTERQSAANAVIGLLLKAWRENDHDLVGHSLDVLREKSPRTTRPGEFSLLYAEHLERLESRGDIEGLRAHMKAFVLCCPDEFARVRPLAARHASDGSEYAGAFVSLLAAIDAREAEMTRLAGTTSSTGGGRAAAAEGRERGILRREPPLPPKSGLPLAARIGMVIAGLGSLLAPIVLVVLTLRLGLVSFRWYAVCAVWIGLSIGFVLGVVLRDEDVTPTASRDSASPRNPVVMASDRAPSLACSFESRPTI